MRKLDSEGQNTGYPYKSPSVFKDQLPVYNPIQIPPIVPGMEGPPSDHERCLLCEDDNTLSFYIYIPRFVETYILAVRRAGHPNMKTKMLDFEARILIGWLARLFPSRPIRTRVSKLNMFVFIKVAYLSHSEYRNIESIYIASRTLPSFLFFCVPFICKNYISN